MLPKVGRCQGNFKGLDASHNNEMEELEPVGFNLKPLAYSSISNVFWRLLEKGLAAVALAVALAVGVLCPGSGGDVGFVSRAAHFASKRSSSWGSLDTVTVS